VQQYFYTREVITIAALSHIQRHSMLSFDTRCASLCAMVALVKIMLEPLQKVRPFFDKLPPAKRCPLPPPLHLYLLSDGHASLSDISDDDYYRRRFKPSGGIGGGIG